MANLARKQRLHFTHIFPWEKALFYDSKTHYIAIDNNYQIYGWMSITFDHLHGAINLNEISARRGSGVGKLLHNRLINDVMKYAKFIYLVPINDKVRGVYERWGYESVEGTPTMYYSLKDEIPTPFFMLEQRLRDYCDSVLDDTLAEHVEYLSPGKRRLFDLEILLKKTIVPT